LKIVLSRLSLFVFLNSLNVFSQNNEIIHSYESTEFTNKNYIYFITLISLLVVSFLFFLLQHFVLRQKLINQNQQLKEESLLKLKQKVELTNVRAMLQGQENERTRLSRELHDGIGAKLASLKINLSNINSTLKSNELISSIQFLDETISDLRQISHDLMPETLLNYGLIKSLEDYFIEIRKNNPNQNIKFETYGNVIQLHQEKELAIYRIILELVANSLKYAQAKEIFIQLVYDENNINLTVEDDGIGFIIEQNHSGIGMKTIESRVKFLKGEVEVNSKINHGTSFFIHFPK
jgi:two-component system NarL family sensor kinase